MGLRQGANYPPASQMTVSQMIDEMADVLGMHDPREAQVVIDGRWCKNNAMGDPCSILDVDETNGEIRLRNLNTENTFTIPVQEAYKARRQSLDHFWRSDNGSMEPVDEVREFAIFLEKPDGKEFIDLVEVDMAGKTWEEVEEKAVEYAFGPNPLTSQDVHVVDFSGSEPAPVDEIV